MSSYSERDYICHLVGFPMYSKKNININTPTFKTIKRILATCNAATCRPLSYTLVALFVRWNICCDLSFFMTQNWCCFLQKCLYIYLDGKSVETCFRFIIDIMPQEEFGFYQGLGEFNVFREIVPHFLGKLTGENPVGKEELIHCVIPKIWKVKAVQISALLSPNDNCCFCFLLMWETNWIHDALSQAKQISGQKKKIFPKKILWSPLILQ